MAEIVKKTKAPAKPKAAKSEPKAKAPKAKAASKTPAASAKSTVAEQVKSHSVSHDEVAALARSYWEQRGHHDGQAEQDWLRAEHALRSKAS